MKRLCTKEEKQLLYKNKKQMLKGVFHTASESKSAPLIMSAIISCILGISFGAIFVEKLGLNQRAVEIGVELFVLAAIFPLKIAISKIMNFLQENRQVRKYTRQKNLMINGGTIVAVDSREQFSFVEDDVSDGRGRRIIIDYPSCAYEIMPKDIGKRILLLYAFDTDFQVVKLNHELKGLIPDVEPISENEVNKGLRIPHPNTLKIDRVGHSLSEEEKKSFAKQYVKMGQKATLQKGKIYALIVLICMMVIGAAISKVEEIPMWSIVPVIVPCFLVLAAFYWLFSLVKMAIAKRKAKFIYAKEVIFHSYYVNNRITRIKVYEWSSGRMQLYEYPAGSVSPKTTYGSILYMLTHCTDGIMLLTKEEKK